MALAPCVATEEGSRGDWSLNARGGPCVPTAELDDGAVGVGVWTCALASCWTWTASGKVTPNRFTMDAMSANANASTVAACSLARCNTDGRRTLAVESKTVTESCGAGVSICTLECRHGIWRGAELVRFVANDRGTIHSKLRGCAAESAAPGEPVDLEWQGAAEMRLANKSAAYTCSHGPCTAASERRKQRPATLRLSALGD